MKWLVIIGLILCCLTAQAEIRRLVIDDFSGGINQAAPSQVAHNQCYDMVNFDITPQGALSPRRGFDFLTLAKDSLVGNSVYALIPYNYIGNKHLLIQRTANSGTDWADSNTMTYTMVRYGAEDSVLDQYNAIRYSGRPHTGVSTLNWSGKTWIASYGSEMMIFDGEKMYPARPLGPSQPSTVAIDNSGHATTLTGKQIRYRYSVPAGGGSTETNLSIPSFPIEVYDGAVYVNGFGSTKRLYRSIDGGDYNFLAAVSSPYLDTTQSSSYSPRWPYGRRERCFSDDVNESCSCLTLGSKPVGAPTVALVGAAADSGYGIAWPDTGNGGVGTLWGKPSQKNMAYTVVFVDTLGRRSYMGPPYCVSYDQCNASTCTGYNNGGSSKMSLTAIPLAPDTNIIVKRIILRSFARACRDTIPGLQIAPYSGGPCPGPDGDFDPIGCRDAGNWYMVDTLYDDTATTYTDSMPACSIHTDDRLYCEEWEPYFTGGLYEYLTQEDATADNPAANCLDSVIQFKPTAIIQRGAQAYAIGDPRNPNRIYMSTFYDPDVEWTPSTWPLDKYIEVFPNGDDWFVALAVLGDDIYAFRQNSIVKISGLEFWSWQVETISAQVGAIAPQSVVATLTHIYFAGNSGIYVTNGGEPIKISTPIDSIWTRHTRKGHWMADGTWAADTRRFAIGGMVKGEYWLQTHTDYKVLVFNEDLGSWRTYDINCKIIRDYGADTTELDWVYAEPIIVINDSLFQQHPHDELDHFDTAGVCSYTSRVLFDGPERVKIHYVDIQGRGLLDSILIYGYREQGHVIDTAWSGKDSLVWGGTIDMAPSERVRFIIDKIVPAYQFKMECYPRKLSALNSHNWAITSIVIGWQPWDEGRPR